MRAKILKTVNKAKRSTWMGKTDINFVACLRTLRPAASARRVLILELLQTDSEVAVVPRLIVDHSFKFSRLALGLAHVSGSLLSVANLFVSVIKRQIVP
jgi:hypothetical protein